MEQSVPGEIPVFDQGATSVAGGDQVVVLAHVTPAQGVVMTPFTNLGLCDPVGGTVTVNSSVGMWRKLERISENARVALAFHSRAHSFSTRPEYVLVQGTATISSLGDQDAWIATAGEQWERFGGQARDVGPLWERWLKAYHWRVDITTTAHRTLVWPDLACRGAPTVAGAPLPGPPLPQAPPAKGTGPRLDHRRAAARLARLPHLLVGWVDGDGFPVVVAARMAGTSEEGILLDLPADLLGERGRRGSVLAHWFSRHVVGQRQRKHGGWLVSLGEGRAVFAPHTASGYVLPPWRVAYNLGAGFVTRRGLRQGRRAGFLPS